MKATTVRPPRQFSATARRFVVPLAGLIDIAKECARLRGELERLDAQLAALRGRLANAGFLSRAPEAVVQAEQVKARELGHARRAASHTSRRTVRGVTQPKPRFLSSGRRTALVCGAITAAAAIAIACAGTIPPPGGPIRKEPAIILSFFARDERRQTSIRTPP